ncbi:MAG: hypothetical protein WA592_19990, partial [Pseudolabrys sp.]
KAPTNPKLTARARIKRDTVVVCGFAFQIAFKAACISPNTPDAVAIKTAMPIIVAIMPEDFSAALAMADCKTSAVWRPMIAKLRSYGILSSLLSEDEPRNRNHYQ